MVKIKRSLRKKRSDKKVLGTIAKNAFSDFSDLKPFTEQPAQIYQERMQPRINGHELFAAFTADVRDMQSVYFR